jgi:hypothetical protein
MFGLFGKKKASAVTGEDPKTTPSSRRLYDFGRFLNGLSEPALRDFSAWAEDLVHRYGVILEAHPQGVVDAARLPGGPAGKDELKVALKAFMIYKLGPTDMAALDALKASYVALARFQDLSDPARHEAAAAAEAELLRKELKKYFG